MFTDVEHLHWLHTLRDADIAIDAALQWECKAMGNPRPTYKWLKNGQILTAEVRMPRLKRRNAADASLTNHYLYFGFRISNLVFNLALVEQTVKPDKSDYKYCRKKVNC